MHVFICSSAAALTMSRVCRCTQSAVRGCVDNDNNDKSNDSDDNIMM